MSQTSPDPVPGTPYEGQPADAPLEGTDLGDDRQVVPGLDTGDTDASAGADDPAPRDRTDPGGPDTQLAAGRD